MGKPIDYFELFFSPEIFDLFVQMTNPRGQPQHDKLFKIRSLLGLLLRNLTSHCHLDRELSIDESMIPYKGRLSFRQLLPSKPIRFGIKCFVLAEAKSGYVANFQVYVGKEGNATEVIHSSFTQNTHSFTSTVETIRQIYVH